MAPETDPPDYNPEADWERRSLAAALAELQQKLPHIAKDADGMVRDGKLIKYADLATISRQLLPIMGELGLAFTCRPSITADGAFVLDYMLMHRDGETLAGAYPLPATGTPQQIGSAITYARRYCLCAVTGVAPDDDDDDGQAASKARAQPRAARPRAEANGSGQPDRLKGLITSIQIRYQELGFKRTERDDMLRASEQIIGHPLTGSHEGRTHNNLTEADARKLRDTLGGFKDRGDLLAALVEAATP